MAIRYQPQAPAIATLLNAALAVDPPVRVSGPGPALAVVIHESHIYKISHVLRTVEATLTGLTGWAYWDVYIYVDGHAVPEPRLVHHLLLERSLTASPLALEPPSRHRQLAAQADTALKFERSTPVLRPGRGHLSTLAEGDASPAGLPAEDTQTPLKGPTPSKIPASDLLKRIAVLVGVSFAIGSAIALGQRRLRPLISQPSDPSEPSPAVTARPAPNPAPASLQPVSAEDTAAGADPGVPESLPPSPGPSDAIAPGAAWVKPITQASGLGVAASRLTAPAPIDEPRSVAITLKAVGDIIPGTNFPDYRIPQPDALFGRVEMFMGEVDIVFGNFESTLTDYPYSAKDISRGMTFAFRTPPAFADVLRSAGFDVLSVANNHSFDFGDAGFDDTIAHIEQAGMKAVGRKGDIVMVEANGYQVAFIGFSYWDDHNSMNDLETAIALVETAQAQADIVVVSVHAGAEGTDALTVRDQTEYFFSENRGNMVQFSHNMVEAGADLVLGHGPHVPRAMELYGDKLIAYSLGNFVGYRTLSTVGALGQSLILQVELDELGKFVRGRIIPVALDRDGLPYIDDYFNSVILIRQLTARDFPETPLEIDEMGYILRTD